MWDFLIDHMLGTPHFLTDILPVHYCSISVNVCVKIWVKGDARVDESNFLFLYSNRTHVDRKNEGIGEIRRVPTITLLPAFNYKTIYAVELLIGRFRLIWEYFPKSI